MTGPRSRAVSHAHAVYTRAGQTAQMMNRRQATMLSVGQVVRATVDTVRAPETTVTDLQALVVGLQAAVRELARQQAAAATAPEPPGLALSTYRWTVAGSLGTWVQVLLALLLMVQTAMAAHPDPTPSVPQPDPPRIEQRSDPDSERAHEHRHERRHGHEYDADVGIPTGGRAGR